MSRVTSYKPVFDSSCSHFPSRHNWVLKRQGSCKPNRPGGSCSRTSPSGACCPSPPAPCSALAAPLRDRKIQFPVFSEDRTPSCLIECGPEARLHHRHCV